MPLSRRRLLAAPAVIAAWPAAAQAYPDRPLRLVVPFPPGGNIDIFSRVLATHLAPRLGQPVIVENRAGAGGSIGAEMVANARPDGYTLMMGSNGSLVGNLLTQATLSYDPFRQLQPIGLCLTLPLALVVRDDHPARTVQQFVAQAKARPGNFSCGTAGNGSSNHLALALFDAASGAGLTHVPYRGTGPMIPDLLAGNVTCLMDQFSSSWPLQREGKVRLLALTAETRLRLAPELPTMVESGYRDVVFASYNGLCLPAGCPPEVVAKLAETTRACLTEPALRARMEGMGNEIALPAMTTPEAFAHFLREDLERSRRAMQLAGLRPE